MDRREIQTPRTRASHARAGYGCRPSQFVFFFVCSSMSNRTTESKIFLRVVFAVLIYSAAQLIYIGAFDDVGPPEHVSVVRAYASKHPGFVTQLQCLLWALSPVQAAWRLGLPRVFLSSR
jgi:hypothetical protein